MLAVVDRGGHDLRTELDLAGAFNYQINPVGPAQQQRIVGDDRVVGAGGALDVLNRMRLSNLKAGILEQPASPCQGSGWRRQSDVSLAQA